MFSRGHYVRRDIFSATPDRDLIAGGSELGEPSGRARMTRTDHDQAVGIPGNEHLEDIGADEQCVAYLEHLLATACDMNPVGLHQIYYTR